MIYELFGLPGSGKTTLGNNIEKNLKIKNILEFYRNNLLGKIIFHIFLKFFILNKELREKYNEITTVLEDKSKYVNNINAQIKVDLYIKYIIFIYFIEKKVKKNILIDEGIIHYSIALYAEFNVEFNKLDKIVEILKINKTKKIFDLKCSKKTALLQIKKRNRQRAALDFLTNNDLDNLMERYLEAEKHFSRNYLCLNASEIEKKIEEENFL